MNSVSFGKQTIVYFKKIARIAVREKVSKRRRKGELKTLTARFDLF